MTTTIQRLAIPNDGPRLGASPNVDELRRALEVIAQVLSVIAPVANRLRRMHAHDEDALALEVAVRRAVEVMQSLQPLRPEVISPSGIFDVR